MFVITQFISSEGNIVTRKKNNREVNNIPNTILVVKNAK